MRTLSRTKFIGAVFRLWWIVVNALWLLLSSADTLVGKYGSVVFKGTWDAYWRLPKWGWKVWIIGFLVITLVSLFEGSFRYVREIQSENQKRILAIETDLSEERKKQGRPILVIDCRSGDLGELYFTLTNSSDHPAVNVYAKDIQIDENRILRYMSRAE